MKTAKHFSYDKNHESLGRFGKVMPIIKTVKTVYFATSVITKVAGAIPLKSVSTLSAAPLLPLLGRISVVPVAGKFAGATKVLGGSLLTITPIGYLIVSGFIAVILMRAISTRLNSANAN